MLIFSCFNDSVTIYLKFFNLLLINSHSYNSQSLDFHQHQIWFLPSCILDSVEFISKLCIGIPEWKMYEYQLNVLNFILCWEMVCLQNSPMGKSWDHSRNFSVYAGRLSADFLSVPTFLVHRYHDCCRGKKTQEIFLDFVIGPGGFTCVHLIGSFEWHNKLHFYFYLLFLHILNLRNIFLKSSKFPCLNRHKKFFPWNELPTYFQRKMSVLQAKTASKFL